MPQIFSRRCAQRESATDPKLYKYQTRQLISHASRSLPDLKSMLGCTVATMFDSLNKRIILISAMTERWHLMRLVPSYVVNFTTRASLVSLRAIGSRMAAALSLCMHLSQITVRNFKVSFGEISFQCTYYATKKAARPRLRNAPGTLLLSTVVLNEKYKPGEIDIYGNEDERNIARVDKKRAGSD